MWPRISIVTPSLNQGSFIEETIQSVLTQAYPNLEYIVIDGESSDNTLSILEKFTGQITWFSEADRGQTDAINKGLQLATGEILAYLNADDILLPNSLWKVADIFTNHPEIRWVTGRCKIVDVNRVDVRRAIYHYKNMLLRSSSYRLLILTNYISQPATFWHRELMELCGLFDDNLKYVMDYDYWFRAWKIAVPYIYHHDLASFRIQRKSKTTSSGHLSDYISEESAVVQKHSTSAFWCRMHDIHRVLMTILYNILNG